MYVSSILRKRDANDFYIPHLGAINKPIGVDRGVSIIPPQLPALQTARKKNR